MQHSPSRDRSAGPQRLVWRLLSDALRAVTTGTAAPTVLDCGGGTGTYAVPLAEAGARVTVVDISADALATLSRRAADAGVGERVVPIQGDVEALGEVVAPASFDLVLAHGVLESVDDRSTAVRAVASAVRPGGLLSVLVGNPDAVVLARALAGDLVSALADLRARYELGASLPSGPQQIVTLLRDSLGFDIETSHGVGVFTEFVAGADLDSRPGAAQALLELEEIASTHPPFRDIASRLHLVARGPLQA